MCAIIGKLGNLPANFFDERSNGLGFVGKNSLSARRTRWEFTTTDDMAFVHTNGNA